MNANGDTLPAIRDERGRLLPGARIGVGNSGQRYRGELRRLLIDASTPEKVREVFQRLFDLIMTRNDKVAVAAAAIWLSYVIGKPRVADDLPARDDPGIDSMAIVRTVLKVVDSLPDATELRIRLAEAFERLEEAHGYERARLESGDHLPN